MTFKVFIDGRHGTTGLKIDERLQNRDGIEILSIPEAQRKDVQVKADYINAADVVFLCLPDAAAKESVALLAPNNTHTRILDASTAHRTHPDWAYGLPELSSAQRSKIQNAQKVAVPGCHASGFNLIMHPLVKGGLVPTDYPASCHSVTGYSGGGKEMIADYAARGTEDQMLSPRQYALSLAHKHLPEMQVISGLDFKPIFNPIVGPFAQGMVVTVPLHPRLLSGHPSAEAIHAHLSQWYAGQTCVQVIPLDQAAAHLDGGFLPATACNDTNRAEIFVFGHAEQVIVCARFDNLGKGASGAALQCMNIMLGLPETTGLAV